MQLDKPKIGAPCNGCGLCCKIQVCRNGAFVLGLVRNLGDTVQGECPALVKNSDNTYTCGIVLNPKKYIKSNYPAKVLSNNFKILIGAGTGCDELGEDPTEDDEERLDALVEQTMKDAEFKRRATIALKVVHGLK